MDIALGVSMTPTTVRMVLVEGEKADGVTVDHDVFDVATGEASATASEQVIAALLGTRESAREGGHRLVATGITWHDHAEAAALRNGLAARDIDDVMLVSELHAAGALAQTVGAAVGYDRTALLFLERDTATLSVVDTADGSVVKVQRQDLHTEDAVAELTGMVAGLTDLKTPPQGVFVLGSGVSIAAIRLQLESATSLPVTAPEEPELALARGAALAAANAPLFEASTVGLAYALDGGEGTTAGAYPAGAEITQAAGAGYTGAPAPLAYSEVDAEQDADFLGEFDGDIDGDTDGGDAESGRKPFLLVGSALTSVFVIGVTALVISLAVSIRPTVDERPSPAESAIIPTQVPEAQPPAPEAVVPPPAPEPPPETIQAPVPVVQEAPQPQAPRTVYVQAPAPEAPAPAPAPPPAAPAPAPAPAPPPVVAPPVVAPVVPPVVVWPRPRIADIFRPPWERSDDDYDSPTQSPPTQTETPQWPDMPWDPPQTEPPTRPTTPPTTRPTTPPTTQKPQVTQTPQVTRTPQVTQVPQAPKSQSPQSRQSPQWPQWPGSSSGSGGSSSRSSGGGSGHGNGSGNSGRQSGSGGDSVWPWPSFGGGD